MPIIDEIVVINRPVSEVFDYLTHATNLPLWDASMIECAQVGTDPVTVGTRYRGASKIVGRRVDWVTEVVDFVPGVRSESHSIEGSLSFTVRYEVTPTGAGTRLRYRLAAETGLGGSFGRAMEPIVTKAQTKVVRANLTTLTGLLEQRAAQPI